MVVVFVLLVFVCRFYSVDSALTSVVSGECVCATDTADARDAPGLSTNVISVLQNGTDCGKIFGGILTKDGFKWYEITYNGLRLWVAGDFLAPAPSSSCPTSSGSAAVACPGVVTRSEWGARNAIAVNYMAHPVPYAVIHQTGGAECSSQAECKTLIKEIQDFDMNVQGWADVACNYYIGGDGSVYEGRGWEHIGTHTFGHNSESFGFCFMGDFCNKSPSNAQLTSTKQLLFCGTNKGKMNGTYVLRGHRDMVDTTDCPGDKLYSIIQTWPHY